MIFDGIFSQFYDDPFQISFFPRLDPEATPCNPLIAKADSCNLTDLFLKDQELSWEEFEKLTSGGTIRNLYFASVSVKDHEGQEVQLEKLLQKLPNIEKFGTISV